MLASTGGYASISRLLLDYDAMVDLRDKKGWSALMFAVAGGYIDLVFHLLEKGAQVNLQDVSGTSPLMLSCFTGHLRITKILLANDADVNLHNIEGLTALMMSSYNGHSEIVELLLVRYRADMSMVTNIGMTALNFSKNEAVSTLLRQFGGKPTLGKRTASMRDPTTLSSTALLYSINDLQDAQIETKLEQILQAFLPRPSTDSETADLLFFQPDQKPELRDAFGLFYGFAYNWEAIGALLEIPGNLIKEIKTECFEPQDCFREVLCK